MIPGEGAVPNVHTVKMPPGQGTIVLHPVPDRAFSQDDARGTRAAHLEKRLCIPHLTTLILLKKQQVLDNLATTSSPLRRSSIVGQHSVRPHILDMNTPTPQSTRGRRLSTMLTRLHFVTFQLDEDFC